LTATVGASATNLIVFVWVEGTAAQNVTLDLGRARLIAGYKPSFNVREDRVNVIARAERQVQKSYNIATAPGASNTVGSPAFTCRGSDQVDRWTVFLRGRMLGTPTTITVYSTTGASANVRNLSDATDLAASSAVSGEGSFAVFPTSNATANKVYGFHWVAVRYPWT
jgi:hypothetical protein